MSTTDEPPPEPPMEVLIPSLPNEIALNILARIPRQYHAVLSAVSRSIRSAVSSPQLFAARSLLNLTETINYITVESNCHTHHNWFVVYRNPNPINNNNLLQLAPVPGIPVKIQLTGSAYAVVGPKIYVIGGCTSSFGTRCRRLPSSDVWVLDCRSHTWERGPSMQTPLFDTKAMVVDGKVYVVGSCGERLWVEFLDPAVGNWETITGPHHGIEYQYSELKVVDGMISVGIDGLDFVGEFRLDPETKTWDLLPDEELSIMDHDSCCVVDGVTYSCSSNDECVRFDERIGKWKKLKGVMEGKCRRLCEVKLLNLNERLVMVFGEVKDDEKRISMRHDLIIIGVWCVEIDVTRNGDDDWCARVNWSGEVPLLPEQYSDASHFNYSCESLSVSL